MLATGQGRPGLEEGAYIRVFLLLRQPVGELGGDLTLLWSHGVASADPTLGWDEVVEGTVTVLPLDVEHRHVLADESVGILAGVLRSAFALAAERHEPA